MNPMTTPNQMVMPQGQPQSPQAAPQDGMPQMAPQAQPGPQQPQGGPPAAQPSASPEKIAEARQHVNVVVNGLQSLLSEPPGSLSKKQVFDSASDMLAKGAFPDAASRQMLVQELAGLPDEEAPLRRALGAFLLQVAGTRDQFHKAFGES